MNFENDYINLKTGVVIRNPHNHEYRQNGKIKISWRVVIWSIHCGDGDVCYIADFKTKAEANKFHNEKIVEAMR